MPGGEVFILGDGNAAATKLEVPGARRVVQIASKGGRMCAFLCADGALFVSGHKRFPVTRLVPVTCPEPLKSVCKPLILFYYFLKIFSKKKDCLWKKHRRWNFAKRGVVHCRRVGWPRSARRRGNRRETRRGEVGSRRRRDACARRLWQSVVLRRVCSLLSNPGGCLRPFEHRRNRLR